MSEAMNLQDAILKEVRRDKIPLTLFLMNGFQLRGVVTGFDSFVVVLVSDGKQQMIYKHAISTLAPSRPLWAASPTGNSWGTSEPVIRRGVCRSVQSFLNPHCLWGYPEAALFLEEI